MPKEKNWMRLFLLNYAAIPAIIIIIALVVGAFFLPTTGNMQEIMQHKAPLAVLIVLFILFLLWAMVQFAIAVTFIVLSKKIDVIAPSIIIAALACAVILAYAVPYISPVLLLKIFSIAFLAYLIAVGYSYDRLKIKEFAKYIR